MWGDRNWIYGYQSDGIFVSDEADAAGKYEKQVIADMV